MLHHNQEVNSQVEEEQELKVSQDSEILLPAAASASFLLQEVQQSRSLDSALH